MSIDMSLLRVNHRDIQESVKWKAIGWLTKLCRILQSLEHHLKIGDDDDD